MRGDDDRGSFGASRPAVWAIKHVVTPVHRCIYRRTGGRVLSRNVLLLTTQGRKTGEPRTTPVFFLRDGGRLVVCNVKPGSERTNPWVLNIRANPTATVQIGSDVITCDARELHGREVDRHWPNLVALWPAYAKHYERSGERAIFVLEPRH
jgi:F420H(2)-dependent quinone reductase